MVAKRRRWARVRVLVGVALFSAGCGSDSDDGPRTVAPDDRQVPADTSFDCSTVNARLTEALTVSQLTDDELGCYCDWATRITAGGYDIRLSCPAGAEFYTAESRATCIAENRANSAKCDLAVKAGIDCVLEQAPDPCNTLANLFSEACEPLLACAF